jgi:hypothetical protein
MFRGGDKESKNIDLSPATGSAQAPIGAQPRNRHPGTGRGLEPEAVLLHLGPSTVSPAIVLRAPSSWLL